ncbi:MAG: acetyl-CoA carboxylase biotin carboxyl carrier protein subunit [Desulfobulbaceae bacterium]|nr:MAG: acetyl-CoA carboxylase biotin carboxyl carrier protein subunit [Desulfobulbaceae bacterium]
MKKFKVRVNGNEYEVEVEEVGVSTQEPARSSSSPAAQPARPAAPAVKEAPRPAVAAAVASREGSELISAPMPGTLLDVKVQNGDRVSKGQTLMILEAMKMENEILAPHDCTVKEIHAIKGTSVNAGDPLIVLA